MKPYVSTSFLTEVLFDRIDRKRCPRKKSRKKSHSKNIHVYMKKALRRKVRVRLHVGDFIYF